MSFRQNHLEISKMTMTKNLHQITAKLKKIDPICFGDVRERYLSGWFCDVPAG